jgi:hypothetical protein
MLQIIKDYDYYNRREADVLVRVYKNQDPDHDEDDQCAAEVLYKAHLELDHERFTAWLPKGCANAIVSALKKFEDDDIVIGMANEFSNNVGVLTSVRENFESSFNHEIEEQGLKVEYIQ